MEPQYNWLVPEGLLIMFTKFITLLVFCFSFSVSAANLPQAGSVASVGRADISGSGITVPIVGVAHSDFISLTGAIASTEIIGTYRKLVLASAGAPSGTPGSEYQIDGGAGSKKLYITQVKYTGFAASATCSFYVGFADVPVGASEGTTVPPTGSIYYGTGGVTINGGQVTFSTPAALGFNALYEYVLGVSVPTGKYPHIRVDACNNAAGITVIGYLK